jgi:hypothetical protein
MKKIQLILIGLSLTALLSGCASSHAMKEGTADATRGQEQASHDARTVRGLLNSLASPANNFPANIPR